MRALPDRVLVVTNIGQYCADRGRYCADLGQSVSQVFGAGGGWLWFRDRELPPAERAALARELLALARAAGATLTIGADPALAEAIGADGVHLRAAEHVRDARRRPGAGALIGVSAHCLADVEEARDAGADYATLSPIFASPSKPGYGPALGLEALSQAAGLGIPVLALGGVAPANAQACTAAGAAGVAVMGAIMGAENPAAVYRQLADATKSTKSWA